MNTKLRIPKFAKEAAKEYINFCYPKSHRSLFKKPHKEMLEKIITKCFLDNKRK